MEKLTAAKAIKRELKTEFPTTKFSVRYKSFAGGNSVDITYTEGPTAELVNAIVSKYEYSCFNPMEDLWEHKKNMVPNLPTAKYVNVYRSIN